jgi:small subunit ribosomal protein S16
MAVKIRFARIGKKHAPIYRIVAIDSQRKRDGKFLENLGTYNPKTKEIVQLHEDRIAYWMSVGAQPTEVVARLIAIRKKQQPKNAVAAQPKVEKKAPTKKAVAKKTEAAETAKAKE